MGKRLQGRSGNGVCWCDSVDTAMMTPLSRKTVAVDQM